MAYVVAEFAEGQDGCVALIHSSWLTPRKKEVFWPPHKEQSRYDKALRTGESVGSTWELFKIKRIFYESDDIIKAKSKLKESQLTSNLDTDDEPERRRRKKPRKLLESSSSDESDPGQCDLPRPPPVKRLAQGTPLLPSVEKPATTSASPCPTPTATRPNNNTAHRCCQNSLDLSEQIGKLISIVAHVKEQNSEILALMRNHRNVASVSTSLLPDLPVECPVRSIEDLKVLDNHIKQNKSDYEALQSYLSTLGGKDIPNKTNRILKYLLKDDVVAQFSFYGKRSQKKPFADLTIKCAIVGALKLSSPDNCTERAVEDAIKVWLKHAPERLKKQNDAARKEN